MFHQGTIQIQNLGQKVGQLFVGLDGGLFPTFVNFHIQPETIQGNGQIAEIGRKIQKKFKGKNRNRLKGGDEDLAMIHGSLNGANGLEKNNF